MRWALFGPTPGNRPSSSIRSWTMPSYMRGLDSEAGKREPAGQRTHLLGRELGQRLVRVFEGADDEILQRLDVGRVDYRGVDRDRLDRSLASERDDDQAIARLAGHLRLGQLLLSGHQLLLHLLCLLEKLLHVGLATGLQGESLPRTGYPGSSVVAPAPLCPQALGAKSPDGFGEHGAGVPRFALWGWILRLCWRFAHGERSTSTMTVGCWPGSTRLVRSNWSS